MLSTAKWGFPHPEAADPDDVPAHLQALADALDITVTGWKADTWANRPQGADLAKDGLLFWAVDLATFHLVQGGVLHAVGAAFGVTGDVTTQAFGDAPAAGNGALGVAPISHRHGMPANPVTAHVSASDPHPNYALDTDLAAGLAGAAVNSSPRYTRNFMLMGA